MLGSSFLSCRFAVSESRRVQAKLAHHVIQAVGALLAQADPFRDRCTEVRILKVVQAGFDQLPQGEGLGAPGQLGELIEPLLGRRLQPHSGGHAITWIHRCILGRVPVPYALGLIRQSLERQLDDNGADG